MTTTVHQIETTYVTGTPNKLRVSQVETVYVSGTPNLSRVAQVEVVYVMMDPAYGTRARRVTSVMVGDIGSAA
jgi:hypothetical protein